MKLALFNKDDKIQLYVQSFRWSDIFSLFGGEKKCAVEFLILGVRGTDIIHINRSGGLCSDELLSLKEDVNLSFLQELVKGLEANIYEYKLQIDGISIEHSVNEDAVFESDRERIHRLAMKMKIPVDVIEQSQNKLISVDESGEIKILAEFKSYLDLFDHLYDELMAMINSPRFNINDSGF